MIFAVGELPVRGPHALHASDLASGKLEHTGIVAVVHEVLDGIHAGALFARVPTRRTAIGWGAFGRGVAHVVARLAAAALKRMVQPEPMPDLVRRSIPNVVRRGGPARQRGIKNDDAIILRAAGVVPREGGPSQQAAARIVCVYVQSVIAALAQSLLHVRFSLRSGACRIPGG